MRKISLFIYLFICFISFIAGCVNLKTQTDYFPEDNGIFGFCSDKNKFEYNSDKIYILKKDIYVYRDYYKNSKLIFNSKRSTNFAKIPKGTRFKASRIRRFSTYTIIPPLPVWVTRIELYLEVVDSGKFEGKEFNVNYLSIMPFRGYVRKVYEGDYHAKYDDFKVYSDIFEEVEDLQKIVPLKKSVSEIKSYELINNMNFF